MSAPDQALILLLQAGAPIFLLMRLHQFWRHRVQGPSRAVRQPTP